MIKLVSEKEVKERHRILCPHCLQILDLISQIQISRFPGEFHLSVKLWNELKGFESSEKGIFQSPSLEIGKNSMGELEMQGDDLIEESKNKEKRKNDWINEVLFPYPINDKNKFYDELITCCDAVLDLIKRSNRKI